MPTDPEVLQEILKYIKIDYLTEAFQEIKTAWPNYIIAFFLSLFICILDYFMMRWLAGCIIWLIIIGTLVGLFVGGGILFMKYQDLNE